MSVRDEFDSAYENSSNKQNVMLSRSSFVAALCHAYFQVRCSSMKGGVDHPSGFSCPHCRPQHHSNDTQAEQPHTLVCSLMNKADLNCIEEPDTANNRVPQNASPRKGPFSIMFGISSPTPKNRLG